MSDEEEVSVEDLNREILECARYGEADDLATLLDAGAQVDHTDDGGNSALHKANGEVSCLKVLKQYHAKYFANHSGNFPIHWAVQNQKLDAVNYLLENFEVDVLAKNSYGRSALTDAFQSGCTEVIASCLSHSSASEELLLSTDVSKKDGDEAAEVEGGEVPGAVTHTFDFTGGTTGETGVSAAPGAEESDEPTTLIVRELVISRADNPFGNESAPQDDTTGLGIWPASLLMARYAVAMKEMLTGRVVVELGCGCGVPGLAAAMYCNPRRVYLTDIHEPTLDNLIYNVNINGLHLVQESTTVKHSPAAAEPENAEETVVEFAANDVDKPGENDAPPGGAQESADAEVVVKCVNWQDPSTDPAELADVVIGSDLVYDDGILAMLVPALSRIMKEGAAFLYVAPDTDRAGMPRLVDALAGAGLHCVDCRPAPDEMFENPLASQDSDQYVLHFYDLSGRVPHTLFHFVKASTVPSTRSTT